MACGEGDSNMSVMQGAGQYGNSQGRKHVYQVSLLLRYLGEYIHVHSLAQTNRV